MSRFIMPRQGVNSQSLIPGDGALLYFYIVGTTTLKSTYTNAAKSIASANPVVADATGLFAYIEIDGPYDVVLKNKNGVQLWGPETIQELVDSSEDTAIQELTTATMAANTNRTYLVGDVVQTKEWATGYGVDGGATYDVALTSAVTPNTYDVIIGTADTLISFVLRIEAPLNIKKMGSAGDGSTSDSAAVGAALDLAIVSGVSLYVPYGKYLIDSLISKDMTAATVGLRVIGDGDNNSSFLCSDANGGMAITVDNRNTVEFEHVRFEPVGVARGTALSVTSAAGGTNNYMSGRFIDCSFGAENNTGAQSNYFTTGLEYGGATASHGTGIIRGCFFNGFGNADPTASIAINLKYANDMTIESTVIYSSLVGVNCDQFTCEGLMIRGCFMIRVGKGVYAHSPSSNLPYIRIEGSHINYTVIGIDIENYSQSWITNNLIYIRSDATTATTTDIHLNKCATFTISGNLFTVDAAGVATKRGIVLFGANSIHDVSNNKIERRDQSIVLIHDGAAVTTDSNFKDNKFYLNTTANQEYVISSPLHIDNEFAGRRTEYRTESTITSNQTITTGSDQTIEFANLTSSIGSLILVATATAGELDIPDGVERISLKIAIAMPLVASTAEVRFTVERDSGSGFDEVASHTFAGTATGRYSFLTRILAVAGGNTIRVQLYQDSGSDKTLSNNISRTTLSAIIE